jgi:hypothetical protein
MRNEWERPRYERDAGVRYTRRMSNWTAAALVAAVAGTTGYLAHAIPATTSSTSGGTTTTGATHGGKSTSTGFAPASPAVSGPVVTSGGSGVAAGRRGDN